MFFALSFREGESCVSDKSLEILAETTEAYKRINLNWINKKGLKRLASIIEKYVR
ncbi:MAG: hypothetical protein QMD12_01250 [Candidatus Aenigmarchaeota archaeon]|nr:hypothetical protein [Candidatus Aenigmarchaeota archaeon]